MRLRAEKLQKIREEYKLKIEDLARLLDISVAEYEKIEKSGTLDFDKIQKIAQFFEIPIEEFLPDSIVFYNNNSGPIGVNFGTYNVYQTNEEMIKYLLEQNQDLLQRIEFLQNNLDLTFLSYPKGGFSHDDNIDNQTDSEDNKSENEEL